MQNSPLQIGPINLQDFEVPQSVRFGGRHRLAVYPLAGGRRVVERLGPDDSEIQFDGTFSGSNAEARARAFDNLRLSGEIVWLTWESFRRQVVVKSFIADYHSRWWISYRVSCVVVHQPRKALSPQAGLLGLLGGDFRSAQSAAVGSTIFLGGLEAALANPQGASAGSVDRIKTRVEIDSTIDIINMQLSDQSALIVEQDRSRSSVDTATSYIAKIRSAASMASLVNTRSYVGRMGRILATTGA